MTAIARYSVYSGLLVLQPVCLLPDKILQLIGLGFGPSVVDQLLKSSEVDLATACFRTKQPSRHNGGPSGVHLCGCLGRDFCCKASNRSFRISERVGHVWSSFFTKTKSPLSRTVSHVVNQQCIAAMYCYIHIVSMPDKTKHNFLPHRTVSCSVGAVLSQ